MKEGDVIEVSAPAGEFVLNENKNSPIVFNSGGVGQTPFISVLEHLKNTKSRRSITWVHGCRSRSVHAFKTLVDCTEITHCIIDRKYFYNSLDHTAKDSNCFQGIVDLKKIEDFKVQQGTEFYICGPAPFIKKQYEDLLSMDVNKSYIFFEEFGPNNLNLN